MNVKINTHPLCGIAGTTTLPLCGCARGRLSAQFGRLNVQNACLAKKLGLEDVFWRWRCFLAIARHQPARLIDQLDRCPGAMAALKHMNALFAQATGNIARTLIARYGFQVVTGQNR